MDIYKTLLDFIGKPEEERKDETPQRLCPVCWGYQAYDDKIRVMFEDKQIDVNNHRQKYMRIQQLLKEKIEGFRLREGEIHTCTRCSKESKNSQKQSCNTGKSQEI